MAQTTLLKIQARLLGWMHVSGEWNDAEVGRALDVDRSAATRWRNGTREAPLGLIGWALSRMPVLEVAEWLQHLATTYGNRDGLRVVVTVEEDGAPDRDRLREDTDEAVHETASVHRLARTDPGQAVIHARQLALVANRIAHQCTLFPAVPAVPLRRSA